MHHNLTQHTPSTTPSDQMWFKDLHCLAGCMSLLLLHGTDSCYVDMAQIWTYISKESGRKTYRRMKGICLWSHIAFNIEINVCTCMYSFPLPLFAYELIPYSTQMSQHYPWNPNTVLWNLNNIWRNMMTRTVSSKFYSTGSPLTTGAIWKEKKSRKWNLQWKIK